MKKTNLFLAVLAILCAAAITSCSPVKKTLRHQKKCDKWGVCQSTQNDTTYKEVVKWDTVQTDNSEFWSAILFGCDSLGNVHIRQIDSLSTSNIQLQMALKDNKLVQHIYLPGRVIRIPKLMTSIKTKVIQERFTNVLTGWQWAQIWAGRVLLLIVIPFVIGWLLRKFIRA